MIVIFDLLNRLIELILLIVRTSGYLGIFIGMTIENTFFPLPSEAILIPAGALIAQGQMTFFPVFLASLAGSLVGSPLTYLLALSLGRAVILFFVDKYGRFLFVNKMTIKHTELYFKKHGEATTFIGKLLPIIRQLISLPAGFAKMNYPRFLLFTGLGAAVWTIFLVTVGYFFGGNSHPFFKAFTAIVLILFFVIVLVLIARKRRKRNGDIF